jgi:hypothetical protein
MDVRALEAEQLVAGFEGRLIEQDRSAPIALTDDVLVTLICPDYASTCRAHLGPLGLRDRAERVVWKVLR